MTNDPLDPATAPYPSAGARDADTTPPFDVDPRSTEPGHPAPTADFGTTDADRPDYSGTPDAEYAGTPDANYSGTPDAQRPEYSVDQVGDDQAPPHATDQPLAATDQPLAATDETAYTTDDSAYPADADATPTARNVEATTPSADEPLVPTSEGVDFKARWDVIQQGFVDDPRSAVTDADKLVGDVLDRLSTTFDEQHRTLEGQWSNGEPDTEALRSALQRYRAFFERLLTI
ncbi:hypothetical protein OHA70_36820 [Kribbella sp. NBC_00382]|uniref:hypothetical protein n=1 Tax=Kribbella sp. NBC_00382 TaxID=2975967 RepID=UPI002E1ED933